MRTRQVLALALAAIASGTVVCPPATAVPVLGVSVNRVFNDPLPPARAAAALDRLPGSGLRTARADAIWEAVQFFGPDSWNWSFSDGIESQLAARDIRWLPTLQYPPNWASAATPFPTRRPTDAAAFARYAHAFASRYCRGGSFWHEHPELSESSAPNAIEIWNEPNLPQFWSPPDPAGYLRLYSAAAAAIHAVDPSVTVISGGLSSGGFPATRFLEQMRAADPHAFARIQAFGYHPYGATAEDVLEEVRTQRRTLNALGRPAAPLWLTEFGWMTSGTTQPVQPDRSRAAAFALAVDALAASDCQIAGIYAYTWAGPASPTSDEDSYALTTSSGERLSAAGEQYIAAAKRAATPPPRLLPLCSSPHHNGRGAWPAVHYLDTTATRDVRKPACTTVRVSYRGLPLLGARVVLRAHSTVTARTGPDGSTTLCAGRPSQAFSDMIGGLGTAAFVSEPPR